ncbi:putative cytochrome P450 hydroxylase [[Actinomadura] parvosata subsp. kistnae]|uniref:Cytochrome n=1 Tax=[Actinomadura] parvosata subsp. kistnae TaxID=1909395 RepID=A0A1V0AGL8_9ACTN|nr:cytochrome P450 [Nonomuraea sp. ATCC 55076]AQZ69232.1 cytochrome [Nonomuraea sp. ATCC 55076]SPL92150.1 putative cytochrome P450 hydroxylase [Actinomadura parvosata subsp. kistnae]
MTDVTPGFVVDEATQVVTPEPDFIITRKHLEPTDSLRALRKRGALLKINGHALGSLDVDGTAYIWLATGYEVVRRILGDHENFSTRRRLTAGEPIDGTGVTPVKELVGHLMNLDPPEHTRLRRMLTPEFTLRRIRRLEPVISEIIEDHLNLIEDAGPPADLQSMYAEPVGGATLCELIGVPRDDRAEFLRRCGLHLDMSRGSKRRAADSMAFNGYLDHLIGLQRKRPDDGFIGMLVQEHGDDVTDDELRGMITVVLLAGLDNISGMLGLGVLALLEHPEQIPVIFEERAVTDRAVDELTRYLSITFQPTPRMALNDVVVDGQTIKAGEIVVCSLPMANRDEALTPDPDVLDLRRQLAGHVGFGHGVHHCLGSSVSRVVLRLAYQALWRRFPDLRLAVPPEDIVFRKAITHGPKRLPVTWGPSAATR